MKELEAEQKDKAMKGATGGTGVISDTRVAGKLVDRNFEEKMRVAAEATAQGKDPAQAVADYMKNIKQ